MYIGKGPAPLGQTASVHRKTREPETSRRPISLPRLSPPENVRGPSFWCVTLV